MARREYPRVGESGKWKPNANVRCVVCGVIATYRTEVQTTCFRGDDELEPTCYRHRRDVDAIVRSWQKGKPND
jgi:hypothetical protein